LTAASTALTILLVSPGAKPLLQAFSDMKTTTTRTALFDPYALDLRSGELRKFGTKVKMGEQTFQILRVLLEAQGALVTREELRAKLWADDTFVDFDHGLNSAVQRLRDCLSDSAEKPRWVETVPRRGYRFIGQVEWSDEAPTSEMLLESREALGDSSSNRQFAKTPPRRGYQFIAPVTSDGQSALAPVVLAVSQTERWKIVTPLSFLLIAGLIAGGLVWRSRLTRHVTEKETVILGDFANSTGDRVFDGTLRRGLSVELEQSPFLNLVSEEQIHQTLRMMGQEPDVQLTHEIAREVCQRTNSAATLDGSIALIGNQYDLILRAVDCTSGNLLASTKAQADHKNGVLDALDKAASEMRKKLGESLSTVQKYSTPLVQVTTPSLEALQFYTLGTKTQTQTGDFAASLPWFQKAIELDPNFAIAYWAMGDTYAALGETTSQAAYTRKAFELRAGVSEREKLVIEGDYYYYVMGDLISARRSFEVYAKLFRDSDYAHNLLATFSNMFGQYDAGLNEYQEALRLAPHKSILYRYVAFSYLLLNRVADAAAEAKEAHAMGLDSDLAPVLYGIAFYQNDSGEMAWQAASAAGKPGVEDLLLALEADTSAFFGHLGEARELSRRAADSAARAGEKETAAGYSAASAVREALFGNVYEARQQAMTAKGHSTGRDMDYGIALALACAGDANRAQALTDDLGRRFPEDTVVKFNYLPTLRAKLAIRRSNPQQALNILKRAAPYELGLPSNSFYNWPNLYPVYVRGEAYLAAHQGGEAVAEFQKILDHKGIVLNEPIGVLAHLQLGRAYAMSGNTVKARSAYRNFLALWKDADPDIPILKEAKAEYAKLQ